MATTQCPRCRERINSQATRCKHCQADFDEAELASMRKPGMGRVAGYAIAGVLGIAFLSSVMGGSPSSSETGIDLNSTDPLLDGTAGSAIGEEGSSGWAYDKRTDEIRQGEIVTATIASENTVQLDSPYYSTKLSMQIRQHPEYGLNLIFFADSGQILCRSYDPCAGKISIDGKSETLTAVGSGDHDPKVAFASYPKPLRDKIAVSKKVIVELPFYQAGAPQFTFDTAGFEWPK